MGWRCWQRIIVAGKMLGRTGGRYIDICGVGWSGVLGGDWRPFKGGVDGDHIATFSPGVKDDLIRIEAHISSEVISKLVRS
jgi:hypothetical protein